MRRSKWLLLGALCCVVGIASATYVWEPFEVYPTGGGENWTSDWAELGSTLHTISVANTSPIKGGGSYLVYRTMTGATVGANGTGRDFDTTIGEVIHTVKLNVRVDEFGAFFDGPDIADRMQIYGDASNASGDMGTYCTWCVMTTATVTNNNWYVYDGIKTGKWSSGYLKDTGLPIVPGGVYSITVKVYPQTLSYDLVMDNGATTFTKLNAGFRGVLPVGDRIGFGNKVRLETATPPGSDIQLSYDSIRVFANGAYAPQPANNEIDVLVENPLLSWKQGMRQNPADPNAIEPVLNSAITGYYLYLSAPNDPNLPTTPVYIPAATEIVSYVPPAGFQNDKVYKWRVDESLSASGPTDDPNLIQGVVWTFTTKSAAPDVNAGENIISWLQPSTAAIPMNAAITWSNPQSQILWTVVSQPAGSTVEFSNAAIEDPIVTVDRTGTYDLQLWAKDNRNAEGQDVVQIRVYTDSCEAARSITGYQRISGDFNTDCKVDVADFLVIADHWLMQNFLTDNFLY